MQIKCIGAMFIIAGCGTVGFSAAAASRRETRMIQDLLRAIYLMESELQYKMSPLSELCKQAGKDASGAVREIFLNLSRELDWQIEPDARSCMADALEKSHTVPKSIRSLFLQLGTSLGRFDLSGQLKELEHLRQCCEHQLTASTRDQAARLRSYRTLGLCAGAALAILLL